MNVSIQIPSAIEHAIRQQAALAGQDIEAFLQRMVTESVAGRRSSVPDAEDDWPTPPRGESPEAFMSRLQEMVRRHAVRCGHVDDSRESIYAGCGE